MGSQIEQPVPEVIDKPKAAAKVEAFRKQSKLSQLLTILSTAGFAAALRGKPTE